jgi:hypothetical protein
VNLSINYCLDAVEAECEGENVTANGDGHLQVAVVMVPEGP